MAVAIGKKSAAYACKKGCFSLKSLHSISCFTILPYLHALGTANLDKHSKYYFNRTVIAPKTTYLAASNLVAMASKQTLFAFVLAAAASVAHGFCQLNNTIETSALSDKLCKP